MHAIERGVAVAVPDEKRLRRRIGPIGLMFASVGSVIGSGWLLGALTAAKVAGPGAIVSWVIGAALVLLLALIHAELGGAFPVAGGTARFPHYAFGSLAGFSAGWFWYLAAAAVAPAEVEAALTYANNNVPGLINANGTLTFPLGFVMAAGLMVIFSIVNLLGVRWLTETNKYLMIWKIAVPALTAIVFLSITHHFENLTSRGFMPNGLPKVFAALSSGIVFAYLGFEQAVEFGGESQNPRRNIPLAIIGSMAISVIIYLALAIAFTTSIDPRMLNGGWSKLSFVGSFGPYAAIASALGLTWLATVLYIDAAVSPAGTGLLYVGSSARVSFGMARNRYIPSVFDVLNVRRVPVVGIVFSCALGLLFLLPFPSWQTLIGIITSAAVLSYGLQPLALTALRRQVPELDRPYRLPAAAVVAPLAFVVANLIIYWVGWDTNWRLMVAVLIGFLILALTSTGSPSARPSIDGSAAYWLLPYLGGMTLISYLGATDFGGIGVFPFGWDALVVAVFSIAIYVLAVHLRLPARKATAYISELNSFAEAEDELLIRMVSHRRPTDAELAELHSSSGVPEADERTLSELAASAATRAYAPYSKVRVGAALLTESGGVYTGCSVENVSFGLTICAERAAVFAAIAAEGPDMRIRAIVIACRPTQARQPCGACGQVIAEFAPSTAVLIYPNGAELTRSTVQQLLPGHNGRDGV